MSEVKKVGAARGEERVRDPERTRHRLLKAATEEFSRRGFDGARVDAIAKRSGVNKAMIYHYFKSKKGLFSAVLRSKLERKAGQMEAGPRDPVEGLSHHFRIDSADPDWIRLQQWESLAKGKAATLDEALYGEVTEAALDRVRAEQAEGRLPKEVDADLLLLALSALIQYPLAFPQVTRRVTGHLPTDAEFQERWSSLLDQVAQALRGAPGKRKGKGSR